MTTLPEERKQRTPGRGGGRAVAALSAIVLLVFVISLITIVHGRLSFDVYRIDLDVYRLGAHAWLTGQNVYGKLPPTHNGLDLGFTYPPISAVLMAPLSIVSSRMAGILITAVTLGLLIAVMALFLRTAGLAEPGRSVRPAVLLLPAAVLLEPVRTNLAYGQINVVLMALVAFDCLAPETWRPLRDLRFVGHWFARRERLADRRVGWPRGALVGVAAALKLTPAVFVLYFIARRQWRQAATCALSFLAVTGIGALAAPRDSARYWTEMVFDTGRIGPLVFAGNQSLNGMLYRTRLGGTTEHELWLAAAAAAGAIGVIAVFRAANAGRQMLTLGLTACTTLLISPVSWSHHWVWSAPILLTAALAAIRAGDLRALALSCGALAIFFGSPQWWFPAQQNREMRWGLWEQVIGSSYVWIALAAIVAAAIGRAPRVTDTGRRPLFAGRWEKWRPISAPRSARRPTSAGTHNRDRRGAT
jgi:alpha-1,2-mannosyltransferase